MSLTYRTTLVQLTADASALAPAGDKVELGNIALDEICRLADKLLQLDLSTATKAEPGIIVQRGDKGWRIAVQQGRLRVHKSMSLFDDFWLADTAADIANLPPFRGHDQADDPGPARQSGAPAGHFQTLRTVGEVAGLFVLALILVAVGLRYGLPQKRLSDLPPGMMMVTSAEEQASVFASIAGSYSTGRTPGNKIVIITPDGQVSLGAIGKDGKPTEPNIQEQARAARQGNIACVITSFGVISGIAPPETVKVGDYPWKRANISIQ